METFGDDSLKKILSDKTSGSVELLRKLNNYFSKNRRSIDHIRKIIPKLKKHFPSFENIQRYLSELDRAALRGELLLQFFQKQKNETTSIGKMFVKVLPYIKDRKTILTISNSRTVFELLISLHKINKGLQVIVCESRPKLEGRIMSSRLAKAGIKVQLITDAMMAEYVQKCDAVLIGADIILKNGDVVNKVGSGTLAVLCKEFKKPFYVAADKSKLSKKNKFFQDSEDKNEIWPGAPKEIIIANRYFEIIPKKYIKKVFPGIRN